MYCQQGFIKPKGTIPKFYICKCLFLYLSKYLILIKSYLKVSGKLPKVKNK